MAAPQYLVEGTTSLRRWTPDDAAMLGALVRKNLDHLAEWMPWADETSTGEAFQRDRLADVIAGYADDDAGWEFAICEPGGEVIGSCGFVVRDDGRREIGYWVHVDHVRRGHATRAAAALTRLWRDARREARIEIRCDEANHASAAIPKKLGYDLECIVDGERQARAETGRTMVWVLRREAAAD